MASTFGAYVARAEGRRLLGGMEQVDVLVVGAGQAGLSLSNELTRAGVEHVVLERGRIGQSWRDRWDSFCLVTPNWAIQLAHAGYDGDDPDGFMPRDEIAAFLERYASGFGAPVHENVDVTAIRRSDGGFAVDTTTGPMRARRVALACGAFQRPNRPAGAKTLPAAIQQLDVGDYRNPDALPSGAVLVVGSGQSGCQVAEELREVGREVVLSCGRAPWIPRRIGGRDVVWWVMETGFLDQTVESLPDPRARLWANLQNTGHGGGHDLNCRTLRAMGVTLAGRFQGAEGGWLHFAPDLAESVSWGDDTYRLIAAQIRQLVAQRGLPDPGLPEPEPFSGEGPERLPVGGFGAAIFAGGFRPAYASWLPWPEAFDEMGFPIHRDGESTVVPGLHFIGVHFLRKRKSSFLIGIGEDAGVVAARIAAGPATVRG